MKPVIMTALALAAAGIPQFPVLAQIDPVAVGQSGVHSATMRNHADRLAASGKTNPQARERRARAVCAQRAALRARHGPGDPGIRELYDLCGRLGY